MEEDQALVILASARAATDNGVRHDLDEVARDLGIEEDEEK